MAKEKQARRMIAMALAAAVTMSSVPVVAFAEEVADTGTTTETTGPTTTGEGTKSDPQLTVTVTVNKNEDTTTTVKETDTTWKDQPSESKTVDFDGEKVNTTVRETVSDTEAPAEPQGDVIREHETTDDTTTTVETTEDGTTTTVENVQTETGVREDGTIVDSEVTNTQVTKTDADGNVVEEYETEVGSERLEETVKEDAGNGDQPAVEVKLEIGKTTSQAVTSTTTTGDVPIFDWDTDYDYTVVEEVERTVTATTSEIKVTVNDSATGVVGDEAGALKGLDPVYDETDEYKLRTDGRIDDTTGKDGLFDRNFLSGGNTDPSKWTNIPPEGEYKYVGTGEHSKYYAGLVKVIYQKDEAGNTVYDADGNPVIEKLVNNVNNTDHTSGGELVTEILPEYAYDTGFAGSRAQNFMLMDKDGNKVYAYCCDAQTGAVNGKWYSVSNLEDSEYYTPEAEDHIRSIVMNGYWGTSDIPTENEDGTKTYQTGSLEGIKDNMLKAIENGEIERYVQVPVRDTSTAGAGKIQVDEDGNPIYYEEKVDLVEILSGMTEGEALLATQAAIWSFANGSQGATSGIDGPVVATPDWYRNHQIGYSSTEGEPLDDAAGVRVAALYNWLLNLKTEEESTVVVNEKNFVEDMSLVVDDKVEGHENNLDDNVDNDVYNAALNFKLAFVPGDNDDLLVQVTYTDMDGVEQNVVRRLAGENAEGQTYEGIKPEEDGSYVIKGLQLSENEDFNFDLRLEGTQYLEQGVYVYAPVGGRDVSQTFVGIAEGERNVDISMGVTVSFDVDENDRVVAKREWSSDSRKTSSGGGSSDPEDPTPDPEDPNPTPEEPPVEIEDPDVPLADEPEVEGEETVEIGDEEVPMADGPLVAGDEEVIAQTGDSNHLTGAFGGMFAALAGMFMLRRKKEN